MQGPTKSDILSEYLHREQAAGGLGNCDAAAVAYDVARHFDIPFADVRDAVERDLSQTLAAG